MSPHPIFLTAEDETTRRTRREAEKALARFATPEPAFALPETFGELVRETGGFLRGLGTTAVSNIRAIGASTAAITRGASAEEALREQRRIIAKRPAPRGVGESVGRGFLEGGDLPLEHPLTAAGIAFPPAGAVGGIVAPTLGNVARFTNVAARTQLPRVIPAAAERSAALIGPRAPRVTAAARKAPKSARETAEAAEREAERARTAPLPGQQVLAEAPRPPSRVFHGSPNVFERFDPGKANPDALYGPGAYFTENPDVASGYARTRRGETGASNVRPARLNVSNPFDVEAPASPNLVRILTDNGLQEVSVFRTNRDVYREALEQFGNKSEVNDWLSSNGFDSITHIGGRNTGTAPHRVWVVLPDDAGEFAERIHEGITRSDAVQRINVNALRAQEGLPPVAKPIRRPRTLRQPEPEPPARPPEPPSEPVQRIDVAAARRALAEEQAQPPPPPRSAEGSALPSGRVPGGPRAVPLGDMPPRQPPPPRTALGPEPELPSGRRPGGPGRTPPTPETDPHLQLQRALEPESEPLIERLRAAIPREFYDRNFALKQLETETGVPARKMAQIVPGSIAAGENTVRRFFMPVVKRVQKDGKALEEYMVLKRMEDILARNPEARLPGGINGWQGVIRAQETIANRLGPDRFRAVQEAANDLWRLNDEQDLQLLLREGILNEDAYRTIKSAHPHYIPFQRADFVDDVAKSFNVPRGEASLSSTGIKNMGLEGSDRALSDPLNRLLAEPIKTRQIVAKNRAARTIVEALETLQAETGIEQVRFIEPKRELRIAERVTGQRVSRLTKAEHSRLFDTISFYKDGVKHTVEVPAEFARVAKGLDSEPNNVLTTVAKAFTAPLRFGATTFNPFFLPVNIMRDAMSAAFREKVFPFGPDYLAGLWAAIRKNSTFDEAAESGALLSGIVENMASLPRRPVRTGGIQAKSAVDALLFVPRLVEQANIIAERGVRIGTFRQLRREGLNELESAVRARDVTVDFAKSGNTMRVINMIIPFTNAALQGGANMARTMRAHPDRVGTFGALFLAPTVMARVNNMRFETSDLIPDYEYTRNWVIQTGEGTRKDGTKFPIYVKIPKGEIAGLLTFPAEAMFSLARESEDRSAVDLLLENGMQQALNLSPVDPTIVSSVPGFSTVASLITNQNLFTGAPIIPRGEEARLPEQQFGPETSRIAIALGQQFKVSPRLIDFAINDYLAGAGQSSNWLLSQGLDAVGFAPEMFGQDVGEAQPEGIEAASRIPGVRSFVSTRATQVERRGFAQLDEASEETNRAFAQIPDMNRLGVRLGDVGRSIRGVELTPAQRAQYQRELGETVIPAMTQITQSSTWTRLSNDDKRTLAQTVLDRLREQARLKVLGQVVTPQPTRVKAMAR